MDLLRNLKENLEKEMLKDNKIKNISNKNINQDEIELAQKLDAVIEYAIDRFEDNIAVCENRKNGNMKEIPKDNLPEGLHEGDVFKEINGKYFVDNLLQGEISTRIKNKMNNLWN